MGVISLGVVLTVVENMLCRPDFEGMPRVTVLNHQKTGNSRLADAAWAGRNQAAAFGGNKDQFDRRTVRFEPAVRESKLGLCRATFHS